MSIDAVINASERTWGGSVEIIFFIDPARKP